MVALQVKVEGARQMRKSLKAAGEDLSDLKEASYQTGLLIASAAAARAPVASGRLAATIRPARSVSGVTIRAGSASVRYAGPTHWGWPARNLRARPFLSEAAQETEERWLDF